MFGGLWGALHGFSSPSNPTHRIPQHGLPPPPNCLQTEPPVPVSNDTPG